MEDAKRSGCLIAAWPEWGQNSPMDHVSFFSITEQFTEHLRGEILRGRWRGELPGRHQLAAAFGLNNKTVESALRQLESDGLLVSQGAGRRRRINTEATGIRRALRIAILTFDFEEDRRIGYMSDLYHSLSDAGHTVLFAPRSQSEMQFNLKRISRHVEETKADAWVVLAGSREILEWFAARPDPAFAVFGQRQDLAIAGFGPDKAPAINAATGRLIELGHRRIVLLVRRARRKPVPSLSVLAFLDSLKSAGIRAGDYNLPDWAESKAGFKECLEALFSVTPPTALIVDEVPWFIATLHFLARRGLRVPGDVSLVCTDDDPALACCEPSIACIKWDIRPLVRRVVNWAGNVSHGKPDLRQSLTPAVFMDTDAISRPPHSAPG